MLWQKNKPSFAAWIKEEWISVTRIQEPALKAPTGQGGNQNALCESARILKKEKAGGCHGWAGQAEGEYSGH